MSTTTATRASYCHFQSSQVIHSKSGVGNLGVKVMKLNFVFENRMIEFLIKTSCFLKPCGLKNNLGDFVF